MAERNNSHLLDGGDDPMGMTDNQYKGMLLDQLEDWQEVLDLAIKAGNTEIQEKVEKQIRKINEKLKFYTSTKGRAYGNVGSLLLYLKGVDQMEKILRLNEQDIVQALADHFNVDRAKVNLTVKIRTEGYGPTEHQFPEVSADIKEG